MGNRITCRRCSCLHDGSIPGFAVGECNCHRIGGAFISEMPHEFDPSEKEIEADAMDMTQPFCACGRVVGRCDGSRSGCKIPRGRR